MNPFRRVLRKWYQLDAIAERTARAETVLEKVREALGRVEARQSAADPSPALRDHEFRVWSQWGEDGILDHLTRLVPLPRRYFVEFGVEDYAEANTRFLLTERGWSGLLLEGEAEYVARIRASPLLWRHQLTVGHAFITRENINGLLRTHGAEGPIGLLSIDVDGNDYWVWEAIDAVQPALVVMEYNAFFGPDRAVTVPYEPDFRRTTAHFSQIYVGASLRALVRLGQRKGYAFLGTNRAGNNAFFVQRERRPEILPELTVEEGFTPAQFREARDRSGTPVLLPAAEVIKLIDGMPLVEIPA